MADDLIQHVSSPVSVDDDQTEPWPACCCVAAFVAAALKHWGIRTIDHSSIARKLGIRVGPNDDNPWELPIETDPHLCGISASDAQNRIPLVLNEFNNRLAFRHVPFCQVTLGLFPECLNEAIGKSCVVGVGFNYSLLMGRSQILRHVSRVASTKNPDEALLMDDSAGQPTPKQYVKWIDLEAAVYSVNDGFWIIGPKAAMREFDLARAATIPTL